MSKYQFASIWFLLQAILTRMLIEFSGPAEGVLDEIIMKILILSYAGLGIMSFIFFFFAIREEGD